ncbi:hypothetical protein D9Q98_003328 [Chlorella vulgaris]|uniref:Uncharacterized protein n=1 Tax=Chlorella vulgaris TaxID=3077 RepID=A0A9D4YYP0_CHLVU|nr:hypothetical protein D9Q98_003328 [Chlorella vulgaris]
MSAVLRLAARLGQALLPPPRPAPIPPLELERIAHLQAQLVHYLQRLRAAEEQCRAGNETSAARAALLATVGFELELRASSIPGAGRGVFMTAGSCPDTAVLTLYPGLIRDLSSFVTEVDTSAPDEAFAPIPPSFTLNNSYLLQLCCRGRTWLVDGRPCGVSARNFLGVAAGSSAVNSSWLELEQPGNVEKRQAGLIAKQAALGNMVNHCNEAGASAAFDMIPLPNSLPLSLRRLLPSLTACANRAEEGLCVPLLVARRHISVQPSDPVELLVDYGVTNPNALGYHL